MTPRVARRLREEELTDVLVPEEELIGRYLLTSKLMFAPLSAVLAEFAKLWSTGELQGDMLVSFTALA